jgi:hypothetical protein
LFYRELSLPVLRAKKEVFEWLKQGYKTIDVRKGKPQRGEFAVFLCGPNRLTMKVVRVETGLLSEVIRQDNYKSIIPSAMALEAAVAYLCGIYPGYSGVFTAYYICPVDKS